MVYKEELRDLFTVPEEYSLAHCISADFAMGKGIAVEFVKQFDMKRLLIERYGRGYCEHFREDNVIGDCLREGKVFNLVTKERYWHKPTEESMRVALQKMKRLCDGYTIQKVAMPLTGAGLDKMNWGTVKDLMQEIFGNSDIEILVCRLA